MTDLTEFLSRGGSCWHYAQCLPASDNLPVSPPQESGCQFPPASTHVLRAPLSFLPLFQEVSPHHPQPFAFFYTVWIFFSSLKHKATWPLSILPSFSVGGSLGDCMSDNSQHRAQPTAPPRWPCNKSLCLQGQPHCRLVPWPGLSSLQPPPLSQGTALSLVGNSVC